VPSPARQSGKLAFSRARGAAVLIVDDDVMVRTVAVTLLVQMGARGESVATSTEASVLLARESAAGRPFAMVLLDLHLERELGTDVCRRLRSEGVAIPIVGMSGDGDALAALTHDARFNGSIAKPFSAQDLYACVERLAGGEHLRTLE
jgi:CheY-like chemotaxis protein